MQNLLEERSKQKAREVVPFQKQTYIYFPKKQVVHLQGQVKVLEDEVEQQERRRELRLEEGEAIMFQRIHR